MNASKLLPEHNLPCLKNTEKTLARTTQCSTRKSSELDNFRSSSGNPEIVGEFDPTIGGGKIVVLIVLNLNRDDMK